MANFCKYCGSPLDKSTQLCPGCGGGIESLPVKQAPPPTELPAPASQPCSAPPPHKKLTKPLFLLIIAAAAIVALVLVINLATSGQEGKNYFKIGNDQVPSVKLALGERRNITGTGTSTSRGVTTLIVNYQVKENQGAEMRKYAEALTNDYGFVNAKDYNFDEPTGYEFLFAKKSEKEGYIVVVQIDYNVLGYDLTISRGEGTLDLFNDGGNEPDGIDKPDESVGTGGAAPQAEMVEVYIPARIISSADDNNIQETAAKEGFKAVKNDDGSYTYNMTKEQQQKSLDELKNYFVEITDSLLDGNITALKDIKCNDDFSVIELFFTKDIADDAESFQAIIDTFGYNAPIYQLYQGKGDEAKTELRVYEVNSGRLIVTYFSPDEFYGL